MELKQAFFVLRHGSSKGLPEYLEAVKTIEDNCPPVVRCRECVYYRDAQDWDGHSYKACHLRADVIIQERKWDDFCSYGERRSESDHALPAQ